MLHTPKLYNSIHHIHHKYDPPFALAGELQHPVEFLFNILVPLMLGPILSAVTTGVHGTSCVLWWFDSGAGRLLAVHCR